MTENYNQQEPIDDPSQADEIQHIRDVDLDELMTTQFKGRVVRKDLTKQLMKSILLKNGHKKLQTVLTKDMFLKHLQKILNNFSGLEHCFSNQMEEMVNSSLNKHFFANAD